MVKWRGSIRDTSVVCPGAAIQGLYLVAVIVCFP